MFVHLFILFSHFISFLSDETTTFATTSADDDDDDDELQGNFPTLTRMGTNVYISFMIRGMFDYFDWKYSSFLFHNHGAATGKGNSICSFISVAVLRMMENQNKTMKPHGFDEETVSHDEIRRILNKTKSESRSEFARFCFHIFVVYIISVAVFIT